MFGIFVSLALGQRFWQIGQSPKETGREHMQIGEPLRTIVVEPLELPVKQPTAEPEPIQSPEPEPERVPAAL
jgi:hypothetical protein